MKKDILKTIKDNMQKIQRNKKEVVDNVYAPWHNDETYYIIYEDGSDVIITAEEILSGEPFPEMSHIAYAEMSSADEHMDTETGELHWYSDERMEACDWNYGAEDQAKWEYDTAIQFKFGTEWSKQFHLPHPDVLLTDEEIASLIKIVQETAKKKNGDNFARQKALANLKSRVYSAPDVMKKYCYLVCKGYGAAAKKLLKKFTGDTVADKIFCLSIDDMRAFYLEMQQLEES